MRDYSSASFGAAVKEIHTGNPTLTAAAILDQLLSGGFPELNSRERMIAGVQKIMDRLAGAQ